MCDSRLGCDGRAEWVPEWKHVVEVAASLKRSASTGPSTALPMRSTLSFHDLNALCILVGVT
jgi:hypothetical protein